ncbi:MAG: hypothetical protein ACK5Q2_15215 [Bacteroidota bacterium]|jgi:uncharacterized protein (DUF1778 family)
MSTIKEERLVVRITAAERKALQEFATSNNTTVSDVIRHNLFEYGEVILPVHVKPTATHYPPVKSK